MSVGKVYLIGAGCGDYDLITLRGKRLLEQCDCVVYDALIDKRLLEFCENAEKISVGKRGGKKSARQENINELLIQKASEGKTVARLKGGDPFVFGRGGEEIIALNKKNIPYMVCPGISSAIAVPELAGIPVTHRKTSRGFSVVTGHTADDLLPENIKKLAGCEGTLVFLMGLKNIEKLAHTLIENGRNEDEPVAVVSNGASVFQCVIKASLKDISKKVKENNVTSPAVIIVGETSAFDFSDTYSLPLSKTTVTVTGTRKVIDNMTQSLECCGANVHRLESLKICRYNNNTALYNALDNISLYSCIAFTSAISVEIFFDELAEMEIDIRKFGGVKFAAIGKSTANELKKHGIYPDFVPIEYTALALGKLLCKKLSSSDRVLLPRSEKGTLRLTDLFVNGNIQCDDIKLYDCKNNLSESVVITDDDIVFASRAGVTAFFESGCSISDKTTAVCIGRTTEKALVQYNISNYIIADESTSQAVSELIIKKEEKKK